jgi:hypothetical protein
MQIDNSGPSFVFDEKTTQTIEEGKNRITLLQVEELRLNKLNGTLESQIITLEADIAYKTDRFTVKRDELDALELAIFDATAQLNATSKLNDDLKKDIEKRIKATELVEEYCEVKLKEANERESITIANGQHVSSELSELVEAKGIVEEKKRLIEELHSKL